MNWNQRIDAAEEIAGFTMEDRAAAANGQSCSAGERAKALGLPYYTSSSVILQRGMDFMRAVQGDNVAEARRIHALIKRWGARWSDDRLKQEQRGAYP